ncbi:MAG: squalene--hopene cyclase [Phycisphaerae bacterium]|nr:squalene--hopene cyclase [Phycisphaerae bacterium]
MTTDLRELGATLDALRQKLLAELSDNGHWTGELSGSALATATAVTALAIAGRDEYQPLIRGGVEWAITNQNGDGGWGDTPISKSNLPTTLLVWSALAAARADADASPSTVQAAEQWVTRKVGSLDPQRMAAAVTDCYGRDRSFAAPILAMCALAGRLGPERLTWRLVPALPFELGLAPHPLLRLLHLPVVSYALPALLAVGLVVHRKRPTKNPCTRAVRNLAAAKALRKLAAIQPETGGFLEAVPLTSFVVMSLIAAGYADHAVVAKGLDFLTASARPDGSWPIDTNLATWVTTLSVNALAASGNITRLLSTGQRQQIRNWLLGQQYAAAHRYTGAKPGGWAWTDLDGGVPDADDTAGVLLALRKLGDVDSETSRAAAAGLRWLMGLQNRDGGLPTFCRGWGRFAFDRSSPDITAHAIAAWRAWQADMPARAARHLGHAIARAQKYLARVQQADGSWIPLWFGNENAPRQENPTYGTSRVLALRGPADHRSTEWLLEAQNADGGWGGAPGVPSSIEETALAVDALSRLADDADQKLHGEAIPDAIAAGTRYLIEKTNRGHIAPSAPIGLYFARLWYHEKLYPIIFTVSALQRAAQLDLSRSDNSLGL